MSPTSPKPDDKSPLQAVIAHAKEHGFLYPSSEIYEGLQAVYDYGPYGAALKRNLQNLWWQSMTQLYANIVGLDAAIFMHPRTWQASGHVESFNDPMIDNKDSKKRYRADALLEAHATTLAQNGDQQGAEELLQTMHRLLQVQDLAGLHALIVDAGIQCPLSKTSNWTPVRQFNLMFATQVGTLEEEANTLYLRPETAQGIFVNFLNVQKSARMKVPFGIAQIGKAFRNEIVARQFIFRMREFEQMEMQFFVRPGTEAHWFDYWKAQRLQWHCALGIPAEQLRLHPHQQLAHYAQAAVDIEYAFPFGQKEIEGIHSRTDFDLKQHQTYANKKIQYFDPEINKSYTPYVIETSLGCDRLVLMLLCQGLTQETVTGGEPTTRTYLKLPPALAPIQAAILPLVKKDGLPAKAQKLAAALRLDFSLIYEESQSIGKRYARQDLIGTPYCITVDHQTLEDDTVTLRDRDTMQQQRLSVQKLRDYLEERVALQTILRKLDKD